VERFLALCQFGGTVSKGDRKGDEEMRHISTFLLVLVLLSPAHALVIGGTNLSFSGYPDNSCIKPIPPEKPYSRDSYAIDYYNSQVDLYNSALNEYMDCIRVYLENAKNDIARIKEKYNEAIESAKRKY
jgi:hypothetical protein